MTESERIKQYKALENAYNFGRDVAWNLAKIICVPEESGGLSLQDFCEIFGAEKTIEDIFLENTYKQALDKIISCRITKNKSK